MLTQCIHILHTTLFYVHIMCQGIPSSQLSLEKLSNNINKIHKYRKWPTTHYVYMGIHGILAIWANKTHTCTVKNQYIPM